MAKLGMQEDENVKVFLEDGTVIEEDNALMCEWLQKEVLFIGKDMINLNMNQNKLDQIRRFLGGAGSGSEATPREKDSVELNDISPNGTPSGGTSTSGKEFNRGTLVLPDFTAPVRDALDSDKANDVWSQMINQLGDFYRKYFPERFHSSEDYRWVGGEMYKRYPSIARLGMHPWSALTHSLSCKMRSLRHSAKKKLDGVETGGEVPRKKSRSNSCEIVHMNSGSSDDNLLDKEDYVKHKKEMKEIVRKGGEVSAHGKFLLRQTYDNRQKEKDEMGQESNVMQKIVKMAPIIFVHPEYLMYEFALMKKLSDKEKEELYVSVGEILEKILAKKKPKYDGEEMNKAMAFRYLEQEIGFRKGRGGKYKNIVQTLWDTEDDRVEEKCISEENEAPKLLVFIKNEDVSMTVLSVIRYN